MIRSPDSMALRTHSSVRSGVPMASSMSSARLGAPPWSGPDSGLVQFAKRVEKTIVDVLAELKPGRNLYANVEFYAGVVMDHCGLPRDLFTPTFASSRVIGWCANILEQAAHNRIVRPLARYVGPPPPQPVPELS